MPALPIIHVRPPEVSNGTCAGHWEGDRSERTGKRAAVCVAGRSTHLVMPVKLIDVTAASGLKEFAAKLGNIAPPVHKRLIYHQEEEMAGHQWCWQTHAALTQ